MPRRQFLTTAKALALDLEGARLFTTTSIRTGPGVGEQIDGGVDVTELARGWADGVLRSHLRRGAIRVERAQEPAGAQPAPGPKEPPADPGTHVSTEHVLHEGPERGEHGTAEPEHEGDAELHELLGSAHAEPDEHEHDGDDDSDGLPAEPESSEPARAAPAGGRKGHGRKGRKG